MLRSVHVCVSNPDLSPLHRNCHITHRSHSIHIRLPPLPPPPPSVLCPLPYIISRAGVHEEIRASAASGGTGRSEAGLLLFLSPSCLTVDLRGVHLHSTHTP